MADDRLRTIGPNMSQQGQQDDLPTAILAPGPEPLRDDVSLTVTTFGDHDVIDHALTDELERRGCRTHTVSIETGWLSSTTHAVIRLDTAAGASALAGLTSLVGQGAHVVVICQEPGDARDSERLRRLCEECGSTHHVSLIWHDSVDSFEAHAADGVDAPARRLAVAVVDELSGRLDPAVRPSFSARSLIS